MGSLFAVAAWRKCVAECNVDNMKLPEVLQADSDRTSLSLDFSYMFQFKNSDVESISKGLPASLENLDLSFEWCTGLTNDCIRSLSEKLWDNCVNLQCFTLNVRECTNLTCQAFAELLKRLPKMVKYIRLRLHSGIDSQGAATLAATFPSQVETLKLSFRQCENLGNDGVMAICNRVKELAKLKAFGLNLSATGVNDNSIGEILNCLPDQVASLCLDLTDCRNVSEKGIATELSGHRNEVEKLHGIEFHSDYLFASTLEQVAGWCRRRRDVTESMDLPKP